MNSTRLMAAASAIFVAAAFRLIPHPANATPIAAMALFAGAELSSRRWSVLIPLAAMLASDALIGFHSHMWAVYGAFALVAGIGRAFLRPEAGREPSSLRPSAYVAASLASSLLFFFVTNFAVWLQSDGVYPRTGAGLLTCFAAGLPFLGNSLAGDLFFTGLLFGAWRWADARWLRATVRA